MKVVAEILCLAHHLAQALSAELLRTQRKAEELAQHPRRLAPGVWRRIPLLVLWPAVLALERNLTCRNGGARSFGSLSLLGRRGHDLARRIAGHETQHEKE